MILRKFYPPKVYFKAKIYFFLIGLSGQDRFCEIHLAVKVLTSADRLRDTLIHEMCHAASWILNDIRDGHGPVFKSWGKCAVNAFPELPLITRCHNYVINYKFAFICQDCNHQYKRHSKSINPEKQRCGKCAKNGIFFDKNSNAGKLVLHTHGMFIIHATTQKSLTNIGKWFSYLYLLNIASSSHMNTIIPSMIQFLIFLWLIWDHYSHLVPT